MMSPEPEPETEAAELPSASPLINAARVVRERWRLVVTTAAVGFIVALVVALSSTKQYSATSTLLVRPSNLPAVIDPSQIQATDSATLARIQSDDVSMITSGPVAQQARAALGAHTSVTHLLSEVTATPDTSNDLISIEATDPDPARAARIANAFAAATVNYLTQTAQAQLASGQAQLQSELAALPVTDPGRPALEQGLKQVIALRAVTNGGALVVGSAIPPANPSAPSIKRDAVVGGVAGLAIGLIIIFLLDLFDRRLKTEEAIERLYGLSALVAVPSGPRRSRPGGRSSQAELEPFRILRDGLAHVSLRQDMRVVLVTSAVSGEGKTRVASGLARAIAAAGKRVTLIEGDVHQPGIRKEFGLPVSGPGLMNTIVEGTDSELLTQSVPNIPYLTILPSGPFTPNSAELLRLPAMTEVLSRLASDRDFVIIDGAPLLPVADSQVLLDNRMIDVVLLVARPHLTTREHIRMTLSVISRHPDKGVGLAINGVRRKTYGAYGYAGEYQDGNSLLPDVLSARGLRGRRSWGRVGSPPSPAVGFPESPQGLDGSSPPPEDLNGSSQPPEARDGSSQPAEDLDRSSQPGR
jgi:succinoglycan biosynthesis transport protein ExoP